MWVEFSRLLVCRSKFYKKVKWPLLSWSERSDTWLSITWWLHVDPAINTSCAVHTFHSQEKHSGFIWRKVREFISGSGIDTSMYMVKCGYHCLPGRKTCQGHIVKMVRGTWKAEIKENSIFKALGLAYSHLSSRIFPGLSLLSKIFFILQCLINDALF